MSIFPIDSVLPNTLAPLSYSTKQKTSAAEDDKKPSVNDSQDTKDSAAQSDSSSNKSTSNSQELTRQEQQQVQELAQRDREVRAHEAAHKAAGGSLTGPASYEYETGPNGRRYAVGGEVSIDTSAVPNDPQASIIKANKIRAAALAPAQPSGQDFSVASQASTMAADARAEALKENTNKESGAMNDAKRNESGSVKDTEAYQQTAQLAIDNSEQDRIDLLV